jgi:catechol 2,3-dioxygenase-like lactoylglutathione lyase family enzyme
MRQVSRYAGQFAEKPTVRGKQYALAPVRHFLSQYRENLPLASAIPENSKSSRRGAAGGKKMLASAKMVGFIPTKDYDKARSFYEGKLGFEFESLDKFALVMNVSGHMIRITKIPNFTPLQGTILGWQVENIESVAAWLKDRGVPPEKYPFAQDQNLGIWTTPDGSKVAWFKDPDGNILSISQHVS